MTRVLVIAIYLLFSATVAVAAFLIAGVTTGFLAGAVAALGCVQVHAAIRHKRERKIAEREIASLKRAGSVLEKSLEEVSERVTKLGKALDSKTSAQGHKIVAELQMLESLMRGFKFPNHVKSETIVAPTDESRQIRTLGSRLAQVGQSELLETIRSSLEQNRVDLYLQPIVSLPQRKLRFYEAFSRLRAEDDSIIMPAQYIKIAAPAGLMTVVDNLLLFRCVQIVRRLTQKQRDIGMFCNISGDTLVDGGFFPQYLEYMHHNRDLAGHIVFEFSHEAVLNAGAQGESNLAYLASLGFALSLDHVEAPDFDFVKLKRLGFRHIKMRAEALLDNMNGAPVAGEDLKKLFERHGVNLIAERVEDEHTVARLLDFGVDFAQGYLFGEPRAVRDDSLKAMEKEPATAPIIPFRKAG